MGEEPNFGGFLPILTLFCQLDIHTSTTFMKKTKSKSII